jgi:hypothetical protein
VDPVPDSLLLRKCGSAGNRTQDLGICSQELWPLDHRGGLCSHIKIEASTLQDSAVGIATDYGLDEQGVGVRVPAGARIFYIASRPALQPNQPPIQLGCLLKSKAAGA